MSKGKKSNMDKTSSAMKKHLDDLKERNQQRKAAKARRNKTSLSRGGFRD